MYDGKVKETETFLAEINKRWLIESVIYMISVDSFDSFSMEASRGLLAMFQDYREKSEVKRLFQRLNNLRTQYVGMWLVLINHQALYRLLRKVLLMPNDGFGIGESFEAYEALLKAVLTENSIELERERNLLMTVEGEADIKDAQIFIQQDILNLDLFDEIRKNWRSLR